MALLSRSIANLFNGVSQQPPQLRHSSQCELQENGYSSIATGLRKRPPTEHIARLMDVLPPDQDGEPQEPAVHFINRDRFEQYVVVIGNNTIQVWDLNGNPKTVNIEGNAAPYLTSILPRDNFALVTGADHTFVLNKQVVAGVGGNVTPTNNLPFGMATFKELSGYSWTKYQMTFNGFTAYCFVPRADKYGHPDYGGIQERSMSGALASIASQIRQATGWDARVLSGTTVAVYAPSLGSPVPTVSAQMTHWLGTGGESAPLSGYTSVSSGKTTGIGTVVGRKQRFSDLPGTPNEGDMYEIAGDSTNAFDNYWVKWEGGVWVETTKPGLNTTISGATMPHLLVRNADGTFTFKQASWDPRRIGDENSNPTPSFVGKRLRDVFFYRNRLGLLAEEQVVLSRAGEYYNFWCETATTGLDTDPIDTPATGNKVSVLNYAVPFNKDLMLFSDQTQFRLTGGDTLRPDSVRIDPSTEFEASPLCRPIGIGQSLFFPVDRSSHTGVREYYVEEDMVSDDAADITAHVPSYIPKNVFKMLSCSAEDSIAALSLEERNAMFVYKYYWSGDEKVQSSWSKFVFDEGDKILSAEFYGTVCYLVIQREDGVYLEKMDLQPNRTDGALGFMVHLDRRCMVQGVYDEFTDTTAWTLPYQEAGEVQVVLSEDFAGQRGSLIGVTRQSPTTLTAPGRYDTAPAYVGRAYTFRYRFSELYVKDEQDVAVSGGVLKLRNMAINYDRTGYFRVEVTPKARQTYTYPFTGKVLGSVNFVIGRVPIESGTFTFPIQTSNQGVSIDLVNDSPYPSNFQSAEWVGEFTLKAAR